MNRYLLGLVGILCAPFLYIDFVHNAGQTNWISGLNGLIYMGGWMCSIIAIYRSGILGPKGRSLLMLQLFFLLLAQVYNIDLLVEGARPNFIQVYLDPFWPLSNVVLFSLSLVILFSAKAAISWRLMPLVAGTWFPLLFTLMQLAPQQVGSIAGTYSAVGWVLLGIFAMTVKRKAVAPVGEHKKPSTKVIQLEAQVPLSLSVEPQGQMTVASH